MTDVDAKPAMMLRSQMVSLHSKYGELLKRGMPPHPRLSFGTQGWMLDIQGPFERFIHVTDARALIELHALGWWARRGDLIPMGLCCGGVFHGSPDKNIYESFLDAILDVTADWKP